MPQVPGGGGYWDKVYKSERLGPESGIIFHKTDQLIEDFSLH